MRRTLSKVQLDYCNFYAAKKAMEFEGKMGIYNHSRVEGCLVGIKGELGVGNWLSEFLNYTQLQKNYETFTNFHRKGDLTANGREIEVKCVRPNHWRQLRMMIPPAHLKRYLQNDAIVVWTTASSDAADDVVTLQGWNYAVDILNHGIPRRTLCDNIWLKDISKIRDMEDLASVIMTNRM